MAIDNNQTTHAVLNSEVGCTVPLDDIFSEDSRWELALNSCLQENVYVPTSDCQWLPSDKDISSVSIDDYVGHPRDINAVGMEWASSCFERDDTHECLFDDADSSHPHSPGSSSESGEDSAPSMTSPRTGEVDRGAGATSRPRVRRPRKNRPQKWTAADHEKFLVGLQAYGLLSGLGRGGAEIMAMYMGNRSVLQVKSHMQKYLSDIANGRDGAYMM
jgi:hypothetical protein